MSGAAWLPSPDVALREANGKRLLTDVTSSHGDGGKEMGGNGGARELSGSWDGSGRTKYGLTGSLA